MLLGWMSSGNHCISAYPATRKGKTVIVIGWTVRAGEVKLLLLLIWASSWADCRPCDDEAFHRTEDI
jgi:hypothetical protein